MDRATFMPGVPARDAVLAQRGDLCRRNSHARRGFRRCVGRRSAMGLGEARSTFRPGRRCQARSRKRHAGLDLPSQRAGRSAFSRAPTSFRRDQVHNGLGGGGRSLL